MSLKIKGKVYKINPREQKTETFTVQTVILDCTETVNGQTYTNYVQVQFANRNCDLVNGMQVGQMVTIHFDLRGQLWQDKCITNLNGWKVEIDSAGNVNYQTAPAAAAWGPQPQQQQQAPQQNNPWGAPPPQQQQQAPQQNNPWGPPPQQQQPEQQAPQQANPWGAPPQRQQQAQQPQQANPWGAPAPQQQQQMPQSAQAQNPFADVPF